MGLKRLPSKVLMPGSGFVLHPEGPGGLKDLCFIKTVDLPRGMFLSKGAPLRCY